MRILITGGAGYLGYSLTSYLNDEAEVNEIIVYDNLSRIHPNFFLGQKKVDKVRFIEGDILNNHALERKMKGVDVIYHLAGHTHFPKNHLENMRYEQINRWGTLNLVNSIKKNDSVKKVIFTSSTSIYGNRHNIQVDDTPQPQNAYSKSKYHAEKYIKTLSDQLSIQIVRSGNIFGYNPCFRLDAVINNFIFESILNKKIQIYGDGEQKRPFVHLHTLCKYLINLIKDSANFNEIEVIADFNSSLNEIKDVLARQLASLEYTYLNQNLQFDSHSLEESILLSAKQEELIKKAYSNFKKNIRVN